jgi:hypothetical protein
MVLLHDWESSFMEEYRGVWFTPVNPDHKMSGILMVDKENSTIELKLYSQLRPDGSEFDQDPSYVVGSSNIILGELLSKEREVTLFSYNGGFLEEPTGIDLREYTYKADFAFFQHLFYSREDIKFKELTFKLSHFDAWFGGLSNWKKESDFLVHELRTNKKNVISLADGTVVKFERKLIRDYKGNSITSKSDCTVNIEFEDERSFWEHLNSIYKVEHFLHFAIGEPMTILDCKSDKNGLNDLPSKYWEYKKNGSLTRSLMVFSPENFDPDYLADRIKNWFKIYDQFSPCLSVFRHAVNPIWKTGSKTIEYTEFTNATLNIAQALEGFFKINEEIEFEEDQCKHKEQLKEIFGKIKKHKQRIGLTNNDFQLVVNQVLNKADKKVSLTFGKIIIKLCESQSEALSDFIPSQKIKQFSKDLTKVRNTLTHIDNKNVDDIIDRHENVFILFNCSQALFYALMMTKAGFSQSEIKDMLTKLKTFM